jgi:peptidyl-prolyl cis-trans isomerase C
MRLGGLILLATALPLGAQQAKPPAPATPPATPDASAKADAQTKPPVPPDTVVLKVGDEKITAADMQTVIKNMPPQVQHMVATQVPRSVGEKYALTLALSRKAVTDHLDQDLEIIQRLNIQKQQILAQAEFKKLAEDIKVTPDDISEYFNAHKADFEQVEIRQISVRKKPADAKLDVPGLSEAEARAKAGEIRTALAGGTDPAKLADKYKTPPGAVNIELTPKTVSRDSQQGDREKDIFALKDGEVSEIVENPQSFSFTQVVKHRDAQLAEATTKIESMLRRGKIEAAVDGLKSASNIWLDPDFFAAPAAPPAAAPAAKPAAASPTAEPSATRPAAPPSN